MSEELKTELENSQETAGAETVNEPVETMADYARELEESYKAFDERSTRYVPEEDPNAGVWAELCQMKEDRTVVKVKIKEVVKGGVVAYLEEMRGFIPASQLSTEYVEKLEDWQGKYVEVMVITADPEAKKLVLSGREVERAKKEAEKAKKMEQCHVGDVVEGTVDSLKPYGAFVNLDNGLSGLLHISQISTQRIKHPGVVLKEGQKVTVKIISMDDNKISLSMKVLEEVQPQEEEHFDYKETGSATTGLGSLLKGFKF